MAVHFDDLASPLATGNITVTGIPFEPVAVMFFTTQAAVTVADQFFGVADGHGNEWCMWTGIRQQASGYLERRREQRDDHCIYLLTNTNHGLVRYSATLVSMNTDGFTINVDSFDASGSPIHYMAIGGKNISDAYAGTFTAGASTGTTAVTGTGFQPTALVVTHQLNSAANVNTLQSFPIWGLGFADMNLNQFSSMASATPGSAVAGNHIQRTDAVACGFLTGTGSYVLALDSYDANGFTVDCTDAWPADNLHGYLAINAAISAVGASEIPDSTGVQAYSTPGFEPGGVLFGWNGADTPSSSGSATMPVRPGVAGTDFVEAFPKRGSGYVTFLHRAVAPFGAYQPDQQWSVNKTVHIQGAGSQVDPDAFTVFSDADEGTAVMGQFSLDWLTATTNSREFGWLALPGEIPLLWIPQMYRRQEVGGSGFGATVSVPPSSFLALDASGDRLLLDTGGDFLIL